MTTFDPVKVLSGLIDIKSLSKEEEPAAAYIENILTENQVQFTRDQNNVWAKNKHFQEGKYTFSLDYTKPFSDKVTLETGAQYVINNVSNDFEVRNRNSTLL